MSLFKVLSFVSIIPLIFSSTVYERECGLTYNEVVPDPHIIGGKPSIIGDWPWIVSIHGYGRQICTGSIIAPRFVLTAAHCYMKKKDEEEYYSIHAGSNYANEGQVVKVKQVTTFDDYISDHDKIPNDIAIMELDTPLQFHENVTKICLPKKFKETPNDQVSIAGFGSTSHDGETDNFILREAMINFRDFNYCKEAAIKWNYTSKNYICAGARNKGTGLGDSGGPLMYKRNNKNDPYSKMRWFEVGVVAGGGYRSFEKESQYKSGWSHTLFARVSAYCNWIANVTNEEATCF
uniref:Peptidase S1 domain-containing protein n=1 Tax=Acrobeloides nanus TaxID=290746 RepID=A0A914CEM0_9BILA